MKNPFGRCLVSVIVLIMLCGIRALPASADAKSEIVNTYVDAIGLEVRGNYNAAEAQYKRALAAVERFGNPTADIVIYITGDLGKLYIKMGHYAKAESLLRRALNIVESKRRAADPATLAIINNLAVVYKETGQYSKAESLLQRSLNLAEARRPSDPSDVATGLNNLGLLYQELGLYAKAEPLYKRSVRLRESLKNEPVEMAGTLHNLAFLCQETGRYTEAAALYQRSGSVLEDKLGPDHLGIAASLNDLAILYQRMGQYAQSEPLYQRSLKIRETKLGLDHPDVGASLNNLASLYKDMGLYAQAVPLFQRSLKIVEATLGPDHSYVAGRLHNLASVYWQMDRFSDAEPLYQRSLKIQEAKLGIDHPDVATTLVGLANLYESMGQSSRAEALYQRSLRIREAKLGTDHPDVASALNDLAVTYKKIGQYAKAEPLLQRSLKILEAKFGLDHPVAARSLYNLAVLQSVTGRRDEAAASFDRERHGLRRHIATVLPALGEMDQLTFLDRTDRPYLHVALSFARANSRSASLAAISSGWLLNGKAVAREALVQQKLLGRDSKEPAVAAQVKQLRQVRTELASLSQVVPKTAEATAHRQRLAVLLRQEQELARQVSLAAGQPGLADSWVEITALRKSIPESNLFVDIVRFQPAIVNQVGKDIDWVPARYVAWLTPSSGRGGVRIVDLGDAAAIDKQVAAARRVIAESAGNIKTPEAEPRAEQACLGPLATLAKFVLDPLKPHLAGVKQIILSPDSELWLAPWAALPIGEDRYAIEEYEIRFVTTGRDLIYEQLNSSNPTRRPTTRPRIFADPDYNLDGKSSLAATKAVLRGKENQLAMRGNAARSESGLMKVQRLPGTADEARLIAPSLQSLAHEAPTLYSEQYALEGVLKVIESPKVLVLSTHGFYLSSQEVEADNKAAESLAAARGGSRVALLASDGKRLENPLLRCGLLLAGCNQPPSAGVDDGVLTGMEIVECDLRGTDLVVLSACETGLGEVRNGEGVAGLRQAFQLAGARAVVSTLWRIPDRETAALMNDFFTGLASGKTKAAALRDAQLTLIKQHRHDTGAAHPISWAAFTVTGN